MEAPVASCILGIDPGLSGLGSDKEKSRALALRTFSKTPEHFNRKKDHGRSEAALLALYGAQCLDRGQP